MKSLVPKELKLENKVEIYSNVIEISLEHLTNCYEQMKSLSLEFHKCVFNIHTSPFGHELFILCYSLETDLDYELRITNSVDKYKQSESENFDKLFNQYNKLKDLFENGKNL